MSIFIQHVLLWPESWRSSSIKSIASFSWLKTLACTWDLHKFYINANFQHTTRTENAWNFENLLSQIQNCALSDKTPRSSPPTLRSSRLPEPHFNGWNIEITACTRDLDKFCIHANFQHANRTENVRNFGNLLSQMQNCALSGKTLLPSSPTLQPSRLPEPHFHDWIYSFHTRFTQVLLPCKFPEYYPDWKCLKFWKFIIPNAKLRFIRHDSTLVATYFAFFQASRASFWWLKL